LYFGRSHALAYMRCMPRAKLLAESSATMKLNRPVSGWAPTAAAASLSGSVADGSIPMMSRTSLRRSAVSW